MSKITACRHLGSAVEYAMTNESIRRSASHIEAMTLISVRKDNNIRLFQSGKFLGRSPDTATTGELRLFQLHLTATLIGAATINGTVTALRFFFTVTLDRADVIKHLTFVRGAAQDARHSQPRGGGAFFGGRASSTRRRSASPMGRACACLRSPR